MIIIFTLKYFDNSSFLSAKQTKQIWMEKLVSSKSLGFERSNLRFPQFIIKFLNPLSTAIVTIYLQKITLLVTRYLFYFHQMLSLDKFATISTTLAICINLKLILETINHQNSQLNLGTLLRTFFKLYRHNTEIKVVLSATCP